MWEIYFVAAEGETTEVPVPTDREYTVSGNNVDGFHRDDRERTGKLKT